MKLLSAAVLLTACAGIAQADVLDQSLVVNPNGFCLLYVFGNEPVTHQQQVTCGIAGKLTRIEFRIEGTRAGTANFFVNLGAAPQTDPHDFQAVQNMNVLPPFPAEAWLSIDVSAANINLAVGQKFCIGATGNPDIQAELGASSEAPPGLYLGGNLWSRRPGFNGGNFYETDGGGFDLVFRTYMQQAVTCRPDLTATAVPGSPGYGSPNGTVNNDDFFYYLAQFAAGNLAVADMTTTAIAGSPGYGVPNGVLNNDDFFFYLSAFAAGC